MFIWCIKKPLQLLNLQNRDRFCSLKCYIYKEEKIEVARNLLSIGVEIDKIMKATGLSEEDIKKLLS